MSFQEYLRKRPSLETREKLATHCNSYNLYVYVYDIYYDWSRKHNKTILHLDGCLNDEVFTPIHLQLGGFEPHFYIKFPESMPNYDTETKRTQFIESLDGKLKKHLSQASLKSQMGRLTESIFKIPKRNNNGGSKRKLAAMRNSDDVNSSDEEDDDEFNRLQTLLEEEYRVDEDETQAELLKKFIASSNTKLITKYHRCKRMPLLYYQPEPDDMYDISLIHPQLVREMRQIIYDIDPLIKIYDVTLDFVIRYLADNQFSPCSWFRLTQFSYHQIAPTDFSKHNRKHIPEYYVNDYKSFKSVSQINDEFFTSTMDAHEKRALTKSKETPKVYWTNLTKHLSTLIPDFRILTFDIECLTDGTKFPSEDKDPVILITAHLYNLFGQKREGGVQTVALSLGSVDSIPTVQKTFCFNRESDLLRAFHTFFIQTDPDIILHHNGNGFDFKYLFARAKIYNINEFSYLGRTEKAKAFRRESENKGWKKSTVRIHGRMNTDMLRFAQDFVPAFNECNLNFLGLSLLGEQKEELLHDMIKKYSETKQGRTRILKYGMKDVLLTRRIEAERLKAILDTIEFSRAVSLPYQTCFDRAQGQKIEAKMYQAMNSSKRSHPFVWEFRLQNKNTTSKEERVKKKQKKEDEEALAKKKNDLSTSLKRASKKLEKCAQNPLQNKLSFGTNISTTNTTTTTTTTTTSSLPIHTTATPRLSAKPLLTEQERLALLEKLEAKNDNELEEEDEDGYEGATVLTTKGGFYGFTDYDYVRQHWDASVGELELGDDSFPVATLDFASLYPSIIIRFNLCFSTLLREADIIKYGFIEGKHYYRRPKYIMDEEQKKVISIHDPKGPAFVLPSVRKGLLPEIEEDLGIERNQAKAAKKEVDNKITPLVEELKSKWDPRDIKEVKKVGFAWFYANITASLRYQNTSNKEQLLILILLLDDLETTSATLDTRQNKKKGVMNSIYGVLGDPTNKYYCKKIAETVTWEGRCMIHTIKFTAETNYTKAKGAPFNAEIIGGDTDSIFIHMKGLRLKFVSSLKLDPKDEYVKQEFVNVKDLPGAPVLYLKEAFLWGIKMAQEITKLFPPPCKLEFEKLITNHNNIKAKNYSGVKWMLDKNETKGQEFIKGLQAKKRGLPPFVKEIAKKCIEMVGIGSNIRKTAQYSQTKIRQLLNNEVSVVDLTLIQKLSKRPDEYDTNPPAVVLARKRMKKDPTDRIEAGEIIRYVLIDYNRVYHATKKKSQIKRSDQAMEPLEAMMKEMPLDVESYKEMVENQLYKILHYPLCRLLKNQPRNTYPTHLKFSEETKMEIKNAVCNYIYKGSNIANSASTHATITESERQDTSSILSFVKMTYCLACNKSMSNEILIGEKPICKECKPILQNRLIPQMQNDRTTLDERIKVIFKKCQDCMQGDEEDIKECMNMSCSVRGERHIIERKTKYLDHRLKELRIIDF